MIFIETPLFTKLVQDLLSDEQYRALQRTLLLRPDAGAIIQKSGGLRKIRWKASGRGKQGGARLIYYWDVPQDTIYMLGIFTKSAQEDLSREQLRILRKLVKEWLQ